VSRAACLRLVARIGHPAWCPAADLELLRRRAAGEGFAAIAEAMGREPRAVEQRWHRLRIIPGIRDRIGDLRPLARPYPDIGGCAT
jgi:hypothetical protein